MATNGDFLLATCEDYSWRGTRAVLEVLDGATVTEVTRRFGVARQTVHVWLRRYAAERAVLNLEDRSSRPHSCLHQTAAVAEARVLSILDANPAWGPDRPDPLPAGPEGVVPGRSGVYPGAGARWSDRPGAAPSAA